MRRSKIGLRPLGGLLLSPKGFPLLRHLQVFDNLARRRAGVVGEVLREKFAEELLKVRVDGEGPLTSFAGAALVDIVGEEEVEALNEFGQVKAAPLVELSKRKEINGGII